MLNRRSLITGLVSFVAAPAIVRAGSLMPVKVMEAEWTRRSGMQLIPELVAYVPRVPYVPGDLVRYKGEIYIAVVPTWVIDDFRKLG